MRCCSPAILRQRAAKRDTPPPLAPVRAAPATRRLLVQPSLHPWRVRSLGWPAWRSARRRTARINPVRGAPAPARRPPNPLANPGNRAAGSMVEHRLRMSKLPTWRAPSAGRAGRRLSAVQTRLARSSSGQGATPTDEHKPQMANKSKHAKRAPKEANRGRLRGRHSPSPTAQSPPDHPSPPNHPSAF